MKPIFNSLGSNYNFSFAILALKKIFRSDKEDLELLKEKLEKRFNGKAYLLYRGRDAIQLILSTYGIGEGDDVLTQTFSCYAIEEAILRTGARPVFVDIERKNINLSIGTLKEAHKRAQNPKAVIVQYSLGTLAEIKDINDWCKKNKLLLIEDIAQSFGGRDRQDVQLGTYADAIVCSFGRDKVVDGVSGGAAIFRNAPSNAPEIKQMCDKAIIRKDLIYPIMIWMIRNLYTLFYILGAAVHRFMRKTEFIAPATASPTKSSMGMPPQYAKLILTQLEKLDNQLAHRKTIARIYYEKLQNMAYFITDPDDIKFGSNLRFAFWTSDPDKLATYMKKKRIYIQDRWYRSPVDCGTLACKSIYEKGTTTNTEELTMHVVNLPTHKEVRVKDAERIVKCLNKYFSE
jgi:perosamine synthetase